jgi:hypothetical protein
MPDLLALLSRDPGTQEKDVLTTMFRPVKRVYADQAAKRGALCERRKKGIGEE